MIPRNINRIHINYCTSRASDGTIISSSIMVNIHEEDIEAAVELYRELKAQLEGIPGVVPGGSNGQTSQPIRKEVGFFPECPYHHVRMLLRTRRSDGGIFFGCPMYEAKGCQKTAKYP